MCTSLPRVHVAIMGMERMVADWAELDVMLGLLARSAIGQALSVYTNIITGPRRAGRRRRTRRGPPRRARQRPLRASWAATFEEALHCIRCGACLNACPVYRQVGGHAYGSVYSGPIGAVLTPLLPRRTPAARELAEASTLCGACREVCPVRIPLHDLLLQLRQRDAATDAGRARRLGFTGWSWLWSTRAGFAASTQLGRLGRRLARGRTRLPGWAGKWVEGRELP